MGLFSLFQTDPLTAFLVLGVLIISLSLHEWGHAIAALWMGDQTAQQQGRVTLNPLKHLDPIGSIMLIFVGFGWAKPVPIYPPNFRNYRVGLFVVSIAGIVINILIAILLTLVLRWLVNAYPGEVRAMFQSDIRSIPGIAALVAYLAATINLALAVFNLLPIPPLDGSKILQSFLPLRLHPYIWRLEANPYYSLVAMLLFLTVLRQPIGDFLRLARGEFFQLFGL